MQAPKVMTGVWVTGFEESSLFLGDNAMPDRNDPRRYRVWFQADANRVGMLVGHESQNRDYAVALTFVGRRSKFPVSIDCYGGRDYLVIADWVVTARYLGKIGDPDRPPLPSVRPPYVPFKPSGEGGVIGRMEKEALASCVGKPPIDPTSPM